MTELDEVLCREAHPSFIFKTNRATAARVDGVDRDNGKAAIGNGAQVVTTQVVAELHENSVDSSLTHEARD